MRGIKDQSCFNVVILGDTKSGKTTFVHQCIFGKTKQSYKPTIEDCFSTLARLPDGKYKTVNVIDTSGSNEFPAMRELRIRSATMIVLVYDVLSSDSVDMASLLKKQVQQIREYDGVPITVIGNKRGDIMSTMSLQIPTGVMEDSSCEHFYIDLSCAEQCKTVYDNIIDKCYENSTWKVEVWAMSPSKSESEQIPKKRGIFSYLSFRTRKSSSKRTPGKLTRAAKSLP